MFVFQIFLFLWATAHFLMKNDGQSLFSTEKWVMKRKTCGVLKMMVIAEGPKQWNRLFSAPCYDKLILKIHFKPDNPTSVLHLTPNLLILVYRIFSTMPDRCTVHVVFSSYAWDIYFV